MKLFIEYNASFELWIISSSFILNCCIPRLGSTVMSRESIKALRSGCEEATAVSCLEVLKNLLTDLAYFTWSSVYQYLPPLAKMGFAPCPVFWCWCIQASHKNMEYPVNLGCIPAQQEDTYLMMYHLPGCRSTPGCLHIFDAWGFLLIFIFHWKLPHEPINLLCKKYIYLYTLICLWSKPAWHTSSFNIEMDDYNHCTILSNQDKTTDHGHCSQMDCTHTGFAWAHAHAMHTRRTSPNLRFACYIHRKRWIGKRYASYGSAPMIR